MLRGDSAVLDGGCAVAQVNVDGPADQVVEFLPGRGGPPFERQQSAGGFFQHPVGLHRALDAADQAAGRIRRVGGDVAGREKGGVGRDQVSRHMGEDDGMFGRRAVQILARGMAALLEQRVVVAASGHRLSGRNVVLVDPRPDLAHDVVDVVHVSHRRRVQPHQQHLVAARSQEVAVGVDEARQERVVTQIHHPRGRPFERHHLVHRSSGHDGFATHCDRFHGGTARVHGDDVVTVEDRVRRVGFLSTTRENHGKGERENDKGLIRPAHNSLHDGQGLMWAAYGCASRPVKPPPSPGSMPLRGYSWSWPLRRWEPPPG